MRDNIKRIVIYPAALVGGFLIGMLLTELVTAAPAKPLVFKAENTIHLYGQVTGDTVILADEILSRIGRPGPINLIINSPGGSVIAGNTVIQAINRAQAKGKAVNCMVTRFAASMAFLIFNECTNRYAMSTSLLLWHAPRITILGTFPAKDLKPIHDQLVLMEKFYSDRILKKLNIDAGLYQYYSDNNFFHFGADLKRIDPKYLTLVPSIVVTKRRAKK